MIIPFLQISDFDITLIESELAGIGSMTALLLGYSMKNSQKIAKIVSYLENKFGARLE